MWLNTAACETAPAIFLDSYLGAGTVITASGRVVLPLRHSAVFAATGQLLPCNDMPLQSKIPKH